MGCERVPQGWPGCGLLTRNLRHSRQQQGNIGFAAACNLGAARARSDVIFFINPDVVLSEDAITRLLDALAKAPPPAIIGGDLRDSAGQPERGSRRDRLTLWRAFTAFSGLSRLERAIPAFRDFNRHNDPLPSAPAPVGAVSGALIAMRRADFRGPVDSERPLTAEGAQHAARLVDVLDAFDIRKVSLRIFGP